MELNRFILKFQFPDDSNQFVKNKKIIINKTTSEVLRLTNPGTGPAHFKFMFNENTRLFGVAEKEGIVNQQLYFIKVPPNSSIDLTINYKPSDIIKVSRTGDDFFNNKK